MNCKFCGGNKIKLIKKIQSPCVSHKYTLYQCNDCKCRFFDPQEHNVNIENKYEEHGTKHNKEVLNFQFKKSFIGLVKFRELKKY